MLKFVLQANKHHFYHIKQGEGETIWPYNLTTYKVQPKAANSAK